MLKPLAAARRLKKLNVVSAILVNDNQGGREWVCHTKNDKWFHLIYHHGLLQCSNLVERECDLEGVTEPVATRELEQLDLMNFSSLKKNRNKLGFKDIINLMNWKVDDDQFF